MTEQTTKPHTILLRTDLWEGADKFIKAGKAPKGVRSRGALIDYLLDELLNKKEAS